jgi:serine/threonine protein kinase
MAYLSSSQDGTRAVIKRMRDGDSESLSAAAREYRLLKSMDHPHIIRAIDAAADMSWIALEHFDGGEDLFTRVKSAGPLDHGTVSVVFRNLASAVLHMHEHRLCHRDVKPENILLVGSEGDMRLFDFNAAYNDWAAESDCRSPLSPVGDWMYRAPEIDSETGSYSFGVDIWGIGATMYFALTGQFNRRGLFQGAAWDAAPDTLKELISLCLQTSPARRPSVAVLLELLSTDVATHAPQPHAAAGAC